MFSCCKMLPSRYSRYLRAQTKPSKHVSSQLSAGWSHTTENSCDKATRHFSNYSKYRICWNPEVAYPALSVLWRDMLWLVRTDKKRSRRLWGALNQGEAGLPPCREASKVLYSVSPPLLFFWQSHHNSTSFYRNNSAVRCDTEAWPLPGVLCAWLNSWRSTAGTVLLSGCGHRPCVPPWGITLPSSSEGSTNLC